MWLVKFGGSLFNAENLKAWLAVFASNRSLVVVPGGGPFADQVREAQNKFCFDDAAAHIMALLAMEQYGRMLCALHPGLIAAATPQQIARALEQGNTPVWMPTSMVVADPKIEQSWEVTSDSLAAWLAARIGIRNLVLVKSVVLDSDSQTATRLQAQNVIDNRFVDYLRMSSAQAWIVGHEEPSYLDKLIAGRFEHATRIQYPACF